MKRLVAILLAGIMAAAMCSVAFADNAQIKHLDASGTSVMTGNGYPLPTTLAGSSAGATATTPLFVVGNGVINSVLYSGTLATNTSKLVSSVASLTAGDVVEIQFKAASFRGPGGTNAATLQSSGVAMAANDIFAYRFQGADISLVAAIAAQASFSMIVYKDH